MGFIMKPERPKSPFLWEVTPKEIRDYVESLEVLTTFLLDRTEALSMQVVEQSQKSAELTQKIAELTQKIEKLEARLNKNSGNSNNPPSSDSPFKKPAKSGSPKPSGKKPGGQKGHKGHQRVMLDPTEQVDIHPTQCNCGSHRLLSCPDEPFYVHQVIELPEIRMDVTHFRLFKTTCRDCGRTVKGRIPCEHRTGYGPRLSALVAQQSGTCGESRETVRDLVQSVLGVPISTGGIQNIIDRASAAILPVYEAIADEARSAPVNHVDETSWKNQAKLRWLWVMANWKVAFFIIHKNRSYEAFLKLVDAWEGILVSDDYSLYKKWVHERQACLAHLLRRARWLSERENPEIAHFGTRLLVELSLLIRWGHEQPTLGEWRAFIARFKPLLAKNRDRKDEAGVFARRLLNEMESLWLCVSEEGVEPTNNRAERVLRYPVTWRNRSRGTWSEKGDRWVERILSVKQTCRMHDLPTYPRLVQAISDHLNGQPTDVTWIAELA